MYRLMRVNAANRNGLGRFYFVLGLYTYLLLAITCSPSTAYETLHGQAQGSTYSIQFAQDQLVDGIELHGEIDQLLSRIDSSMSTYVPSSLISSVNQSEGAWVRIDDMFMKVLTRSIEVANETDGAFDPTIGSVVRLWGFGFDEIRGDISDKNIQEALARSGFDQIKIDTLASSVSIPKGFSIDFNAIAQGFSVDTLALLLESKGIQNYMVELGGEVRTRGYNAQGDHWNIGIDRPINELATGIELQAIITLKNQSLATSGNYRKFWIDEQTGIKYAHTIDPKTGRPAMNQLLSASIVHVEATMADAYATACMVWGHLKCIEFLEGNADYFGVLIYTDEEGNWFTYYSPELNITMVQTD